MHTFSIIFLIAVGFLQLIWWIVIPIIFYSLHKQFGPPYWGKGALKLLILFIPLVCFWFYFSVWIDFMVGLLNKMFPLKEEQKG